MEEAMGLVLSHMCQACDKSWIYISVALFHTT